MTPDFGYAAGCNKSSMEEKIKGIVKRKRAIGQVM